MENLIDISNHWDFPSKSQMSFVDLFCGAGGLSKGLELAGLQGVCGLDFFKEAIATYRRNFSHPCVYGDITKQETKKEFYDTVARELDGKELDLVAGGFPCQGFSISGNRIVTDPRNVLYKQLIEIVGTLKPKFIVCENVKGLRSMLGGRVEQKILSDFKSIGYDVSIAVLNAADFEVPQKRERVIFIGNRLGLTNYHPSPILKETEYKTMGEAIADLVSHPVDPAFNHVPNKHPQEMVERMKKLKEWEGLYKTPSGGYREAYVRWAWNEPARTIKENHGGSAIHPKLPRAITAREMARLQSFPDDFIFEGGKSSQLVQIGNAVPPLLGKAVGLAVRATAKEI